ncbi:TPA: hypothetical protein ACMUT0_002197 [Enterococcus faecium]|uniref:hypothetical protein n=1 Tax=Enterococcus TaxID=1350 RepID=UPI000DFFC355|nr:hypothetical protein [Enterococcus faecium]MCU1831270.1 hypothetical protein [Enterococcus faecium]MDW7851731.1 hypothetical protein [Enterococcus faecium]MEB3137622.1 hypothetical protein [Enterococcus faecium]RBS52905.1 hypothetical protein EB27_02255 [Enterococcus faecium]RBS53985.1 hypothetical protein EB33_02676 [Enterococcus faecium]
MSQLNQTYENYLQQPEALSFTEMTTIYQEILKNADMNDKDFIEIWEELMGAAIRYTVILGHHAYSYKKNKNNVQEVM